MTEKPVVPALDLETASSGGSDTIGRKKSLGKKIKGSFKKLMTPRSNSASSSTSVSRMASTDDVAKKDTVKETVAKTVADTVEAVKENAAAVEDVSAPQVEESVTKTASRLGQEAVDTKETGEKKNDKNVVGAVGGLMAAGLVLVAVVLAKGSSKKKKTKEEPVVETKKKGLW